jgi:hypothetical protein
MTWEILVVDRYSTIPEGMEGNTKNSGQSCAPQICYPLIWSVKWIGMSRLWGSEARLVAAIRLFACCWVCLWWPDCSVEEVWCEKHSAVLVARNLRDVAAPLFLVFSLDSHKFVTRVICIARRRGFQAAGGMITTLSKGAILLNFRRVTNVKIKVKVQLPLCWSNTLRRWS